MPVPDALKVIIDHTQTRLSKKAQTIALLGLDFDYSGQGIRIDPITNTIMLRPMADYAAYWTTNTGIYARPTIGSGLQVNTSAKWDNLLTGDLLDCINAGFGTHACCLNSSGEYIRTDAAIGINRGVFFSGFQFGAGDKHALWDLGWSDSVVSAATADIGLRVYSDLSVDVYVAGTLRQTGNVSGGNGTASIQIPNNLVNLFIIPGRGRELMIYSDKGGGFSFVFDELDEDSDTPTITPNTKFFCAPGDGGNSALQVMIHPLKFGTEATIISKTFQFGEPPVSGSVLRQWNNAPYTTVADALVYGHKAGAGTTDVSVAALLKSDGVTAFTPNDSDQACKIKLTLTGDASYTPFVYGAIMEYAPETMETEGSEEFELTPLLSRAAGLTLEVPDDGFGVTFRAEVIDPETVEETVFNLRLGTWKPFALKLGNLMILDGFMTKMRWQDSTSQWTRRMSFEAVDIVHFMERCLLSGRVPFDGSALLKPDDEDSAFRYLFQLAGLDQRLEFSDIDYDIGAAPDKECQQWGLAGEAGDTCADVFSKLHRLCADCVYGRHPGIDGPEFWIKTPADIDAQLPVLTLYRKVADAIAGGVSEDVAWMYVYWNYHEEVLEIEANGIAALGVDPRTKAILRSFVKDDASRAVNTAPSLRPTNWAGFPLDMGVSAREIRSIGDAERVVEFLTPLATQVRKICEWDCHGWPLYGEGMPLWRMDKVILDGIGEINLEDDDGERLISSLSVRFELESDEMVSRSVHFTAGTILGRGGNTVSDIQSIARMRMARRGVTDLLPPGFFFSAATTASEVT